MNRLANEKRIYLPPAFNGLVRPAPVKVYWGGRGAAKSRSFATVLTQEIMHKPGHILCAREYQNSISDSVHRLLKNEINRWDLNPYFNITDKSIKCKINDNEFLFKGLHHNIDGIKSTEGLRVVWVEEAQRVTKESWDFLLPTIREDDAEIWVSFNPEDEDDATPKIFLENPMAGSIIRKVGWQDNPWFPPFLNKQRLHMLASDPDAYDHIWEGNFRKITEAVIFKGKYEVRAFETPGNVDRFYLGADWGFANDPTCLIRMFIIDNTLYIDYESYGYGEDLENLPALFDKVPGSKDWPIMADCARPELISYMRRKAFNVIACEKWDGSVKDGIAHIRGFDKVVIHERCEEMAREARLYCFKTDPRILDANQQPIVLPIPVDRHNHGWDSARYGLETFIKSRGGLGVWEGMLR